jgi:hypothetical protein
MNKPDLIIYGAGGHGRVVVDAALAAGWTIQSWIDDHPPSLTQWDISIVASKDVVWGTLTSRKFIVAIGDNRIRADVYRRLCELGLIPALVIHPSAVISHFARIGEGTMVAADVVVNPVVSAKTASSIRDVRSIMIAAWVRMPIFVPGCDWRAWWLSEQVRRSAPEPW